MSLEYISQLYTSTATTPRLMIGSGHSAGVVSTNDGNAVSQMIMIKDPGPGGMRLRQVALDMSFAERFEVRSPDAYERLIDRLLASPHYGERWARHWLDLARYAESDGFEHDAARPHAWRYRDYVIQSFNADKPYDRFLREQIAGDELWPDSPEALTATAFNLLGPDMVDSADQVRRAGICVDAAGNRPAAG